MIWIKITVCLSEQSERNKTNIVSLFVWEASSWTPPPPSHWPLTSRDLWCQQGGVGTKPWAPHCQSLCWAALSCPQLVSAGLRWSQIVSVGRCWSMLVDAGLRWSQVVSASDSCESHRRSVWTSAEGFFCPERFNFQKLKSSKQEVVTQWQDDIINTPDVFISSSHH